MATIELTSENLDASIENNDILIIDFWAEWCGPCKMFGPVFEKASEQYPDIVFAKCNTELQQQVAGSFGISSIPTMAVFREKILIYMQPGALPEQGLIEIIEKGKALDMDQVRKNIAEQEKKNN
ncbi:MAG: thiol reductase thioredoxin [Desulfobacteraceae bacterium 4572_187]|nr:MAG: thiol reductase thioredoxin [Desulfobacteraceae bacterium 4572_187]